MAVSRALSTPTAGKRTRGRRAVTASGTASVIQYTAIIAIQYAAHPACEYIVRHQFNLYFQLTRLG